MLAARAPSRLKATTACQKISGAGVLDDDLQTFVRAAIRTVWSIELLILLKRDQARTWREPDLVRELRASMTSVAQALSAFETAGLVVRGTEGEIVYSPATQGLRDISDRLEAAYRERPMAVVDAIMAEPDDRLRTFADAFRLRPPSDRKDSE